MKHRIYIFGSTGSGTSSIGKNICEQVNYKHFDVDDYLWLPTEEHYTFMR
jgi:adenylate kinase family enzyme